MTRDEKIKLAIETAQKEMHRRFGVPAHETNLTLIVQVAEAIVDALDPPKPIKLSGGFHATYTGSDHLPYTVRDYVGETCGSLSKEAIEAWARDAARSRAYADLTRS